MSRSVQPLLQLQRQQHEESAEMSVHRAVVFDLRGDDYLLGAFW